MWNIGNTKFSTGIKLFFFLLECIKYYIYIYMHHDTRIILNTYFVY